MLAAMWGCTKRLHQLLVLLTMTMLTCIAIACNMLTFDRYNVYHGSHPMMFLQEPKLLQFTSGEHECPNHGIPSNYFQDALQETTNANLMAQKKPKSQESTKSLEHMTVSTEFCANSSIRCWDISLDKVKRWPVGDARWKVMGSAKHGRSSSGDHGYLCQM